MEGCQEQPFFRQYRIRVTDSVIKYIWNDKYRDSFTVWWKSTSVAEVDIYLQLQTDTILNCPIPQLATEFFINLNTNITKLMNETGCR